MKKVILIPGVMTALIVFASCGAKNTKQAYDTITIQPSSIANTITATGTVEPIKQVEVGTQVSGIIAKIYVDYNSEVKNGQLIAEIDRSVLETELESSEANLNSSKAEHDYQTANYERIKGLYEKDLVSQSEYDQALNSWSKAVYAYTQAKSNYQKAERNIGYTWIYSPIDGVVLSRAVDEGQTVAAGFSTPTLFTIANDLRKMRVIADVDEADIGEVQEGQYVTFTVDAYPEDMFEGSVIQIRLLATTTSNVVTYEVVIDAPNEDLKLKPGLTAEVNIYILNKENIITVPLRALRFVPEGYTVPDSGSHVFVMNPDGTLSARAVSTGVSDGIYSEITYGLKQGEQVVSGLKAAGKLSAENGNGSSNDSSSSSSPFMPPRPGQGDNIRTK
ncbi:MAG: efflux RND transporter periplasmic adaptor subunit [Clostridia bacterium]|nr:efflux RND transporter periplasmic adaptor subunit [Clostridia bacterium]